VPPRDQLQRTTFGRCTPGDRRNDPIDGRSRFVTRPSDTGAGLPDRKKGAIWRWPREVTGSSPPPRPRPRAGTAGAREGAKQPQPFRKLYITLDRAWPRRGNWDIDVLINNAGALAIPDRPCGMCRLGSRSASLRGQCFRDRSQSRRTGCPACRPKGAGPRNQSCLDRPGGGRVRPFGPVLRMTKHAPPWKRWARMPKPSCRRQGIDVSC